MSEKTIRVGIVGLGANCRLRHLPGLRACQGVEVVAVCNRRTASTAAAAKEFGIPRSFSRWEDLVADPDLDAVLIGAWPYLHAPVTLAALEAGKHVLTEARMAMNATEARRMLAASLRHPELTCQIVPSPLGFRAGAVVQRMVEDGFLGELREVVVLSASDSLADRETTLGWRQVSELSGLNMLALGIIHETLNRWVPDPVRVYAQAQAFVSDRLDPATGLRRRVGTPDSVQIVGQLPGGARLLSHVSGVTRFGPGNQIHLYGSEGTIKYELTPQDQLWAGRKGDAQLAEVEVPAGLAGDWRVEEDFIDAIRGRIPVTLTDFASGVRYMQFTEAVARSASSGSPVDLADVAE